MASNEVRSVYQISRTDRIVTETKVRTSETARFFRVISEVCLTIFVGVITDDFDRVFVSTYSTISTQSVEFRFERTVFKYDFLFFRKRSKCYVILDTDSETVFRLWQCKVFVNGNDLSRSSVFRRKTVATTNDHWSASFSVETVFYI